MIGLTLLASLVRDSREFVFTADRTYKSVAVAGTFNGWNKGATPMKPDTDGRTWRVTVPLQAGKVLYKFVLDDDAWVTDPNNPKLADDGNGNVNSLLLIFPPGYEAPAREGDGSITISALEHLQEAPELNYDRGRLTLALRVRPGDIARVGVRVDGREVPMTAQRGDDIYEQYRASVPWNRKGVLHYAFTLEDGQGVRYFGPKGVTAREAGNDYVLDANTYRPIAPPSWLEKTVVYQIFPDRFANGDPSNDPPNVSPWNSKPEGSSYFGGDVAGIRKHLEYLKNLGVNAVYFNPIFKSPVSHRYETSDYRLVDPTFGTNQEFCDLTHAMQRQGIRTILDGVFNHSATDFFAFADILKTQQSSAYLDWYTVKSYPVRVQQNPNYVAWFNYPSMPKMHVLNPATEQYLFGSVEYWQRNAAIAGWRLDAANEVPSEFWRAFRQKVKSLDPNTWILGEEWGDASQWLRGDQWDASMNYPFREAILKFVSTTGNGKPSDLLANLMQDYDMYAPQVSRNQLNLIGSHDTPRILTLCGGDRDLAKLAACIQMTWVGVPSVYYGDEIGMQGGRDPDNRRGMDWPAAAESNDFLTLYRKLISIRLSSPELESGDPLPLLTEDAEGVAAYARVLDGRAAVIVVNRSSEARTVSVPIEQKASLSSAALHRGFLDAMSGKPVHVLQNGSLQVQVASKGAVILVPASGSNSSLQRRRASRVGPLSYPTQSHRSYHA